jgi:hypothetical protein
MNISEFHREHPLLSQFGPDIQPTDLIKRVLIKAINDLVDGYERRLAKAHYVKTPTGEAIIAGHRKAFPGLGEPAKPEVKPADAQASIVDVEFTGSQGNYPGGAVHLTESDIKGFAAGFPHSQARVIASIKESKPRWIAW